ncbi:MAG: hypothetical protein AB9M60_20830 [Leptothrix sp. (in: b-proteobacteria)]
MSLSFTPLRVLGQSLLAASALALLVGLAATAQAQSAPAASAPAGAAPQAKKANDRRSQHYQRRRACEEQADQQGLQGQDVTLFVQKCLAG